MKAPELHAARGDALSPVVSSLESTNPVAADIEPCEDSSPRNPSQALVRRTGLSLRGLSRVVSLRPTESNLWSPS
jgi:hypothetical protein